MLQEDWNFNGSHDDKISPQGLSDKFMFVKPPNELLLLRLVLLMRPLQIQSWPATEQQHQGCVGDDKALHKGDTNITSQGAMVENELEVLDEQDEVDKFLPDCCARTKL